MFNTGRRSGKKVECALDLYDKIKAIPEGQKRTIMNLRGVTIISNNKSLTNQISSAVNTATETIIKEEKLRIVSGYTIEELINLFSAGFELKRIQTEIRQEHNDMGIAGETFEECARNCAVNNSKQKVEKNVQTHNVTISTEKLKQLIKENYKYNDYTLQGKIEIVTNLAYFENDKEILEFLRYMEED